ncbi:MAG: polysaccharide synthesis/modification protein [Alcanivorax sp.]|jgi:capsular polysaccharide export protein|uniref:capsular polysaccharide export protein, LipB/KpsS family n=1 Tax=Alcanivorax TaxID=59753 RepID=UPI000C8AB0EC|nr:MULTISPECIES: polysaccharide synthesis/modification protein [Alcanivorax]MAC15703.1 polysaccharide synthesis/modification protein [Alcanivorax sp.]MDF1638389.1 polysaccharide synthesis/modification protein [Alcanivorax jadensis]|tara:strand:- start:15 stop:1154 length:1140 start_codon:yes stop_codon:yes gene_type:complete
MNRALPYVLFLAMSRNQEKHFQALKNEMPVDGAVINAKHPGLGQTWRALRWVWQHRGALPDWLRFRVDKGRLNNGAHGRWFRIGLALRIVHLMAGILREADSRRPDLVFVLNGEHYKQQAVIAWACEQGIPLAYLELGYLPNTMVIDGKGINYANGMPRDPAFYRAYEPQGIHVDSTLVRRPPRTPVGEPITLPENYMFVPFQVYDDTQILIHSPWIKSMERLHEVLEETLDALPSDTVYVVKEHPTSKKSYPQLHQRHPRILYANANDTQELIDRSRGVITINSTVGIESLLLGSPVITLGNACYNIEGLVAHADNADELRALVADPDLLPFDRNLITRFVAWLSESYLVPGRWPEYSPEYPQRMRERIDAILKGEMP